MRRIVREPLSATETAKVAIAFSALQVRKASTVGNQLGTGEEGLLLEQEDVYLYKDGRICIGWNPVLA